MMMVIVSPHHAAFTVTLSPTKSLLLFQEMVAAASNAEEILLTIVHSSPILNIILILSQ